MKQVLSSKALDASPNTKWKRVLPNWYYDKDQFAEEEHAEVEDAVENYVEDNYAAYAALFLHYAGRHFQNYFLHTCILVHYTPVVDQLENLKIWEARVSRTT